MKKSKKEIVKQQFENSLRELSSCSLLPDLGTWVVIVISLSELYLNNSNITKRLVELEEKIQTKINEPNFILSRSNIPTEMLWEAHGLIISCIKVVDIDGVKHRWAPNFLLKMSDQGIMALLTAISIGSGTIVYGITSSWSETNQKSEHIEKMIELNNTILDQKATINHLQDSIVLIRARNNKPKPNQPDGKPE